MLKRMFALSDQGSKDLNKGIAATTLSDICLIIPASILIMVIWELLNVISGESSGITEYVPAFCIMTVVLFIIVFYITKPIPWLMRKVRTAELFLLKNFADFRCPSSGKKIFLT